MYSLKTFFLTLMVLVLSTLFILTIPPARAVTLNEMTTFFECTSVLQVSPHERIPCDRVGLYIMGECESGLQNQNPSLCEMATQYIQDNRLQNERRLTQAEVVEDFRIIGRTETEEEETFSEGLFDDFPGMPEN